VSAEALEVALAALAPVAQLKPRTSCPFCSRDLQASQLDSHRQICRQRGSTEEGRAELSLLHYLIAEKGTAANASGSHPLLRAARGMLSKWNEQRGEEEELGFAALARAGDEEAGCFEYLPAGAKVLAGVSNQMEWKKSKAAYLNVGAWQLHLIKEAREQKNVLVPECRAKRIAEAMAAAEKLCLMRCAHHLSQTPHQSRDSACATAELLPAEEGPQPGKSAATVSFCDKAEISYPKFQSTFILGYPVHKG
jgi:hypothetical protein